MRDFIYGIMTDYKTMVVFLHVLSAAVWVGGLVALWYIGKNTSRELAIENRFADRVAVIKKYFIFLSPFIVTLFITAFLMAVGYKDSAYDSDGFILDVQNVQIYKWINMKVSIWSAMVLNMFSMLYFMTKTGCSTYKNHKSASRHKTTDCMWLINRYLLPLNILFGFIAIYLGVYVSHLS